MRRLFITLCLATLPVSASAQSAADAYIDPLARDLVSRARERRSLEDRRIEAYQTTATERITIGMSVGIGERVLYRRETASQVDWTRDTVRINVLGAREVVPPVKGAPQIPEDLGGYLPSIAFDPVDSEMLLRFDSTTIRHPLAANSEEHYRFASGDTTVISLPDGRSVKLRELRIMPRRRETNLMSGSFWLDMDTHAVVQAYFRLARPVEQKCTSLISPPFLCFSKADSTGRRNATLRDFRAEVTYIAIEYGLWDLRWWLPRLVAAEGVVRVSGIRLPMNFERKYADYTVRGDTLAPAPAPGEAPKISERPCRPPVRFAIAVRSEPPTDSARAAYAEQRARDRAMRDSVRAARRGADADTTAECDRTFIVTQEADSLLLTSDLLPPGIYSNDQSVIAADVLREIASRVRDLPDAPWSMQPPLIEWPLNGSGLVRYNRVEGLSLGARITQGLGRTSARAELRLATADMSLSGDLTLAREGDRVRSAATLYRRLDVVDIATNPFSFGASAEALLFGRDDNDFFRATGAELTLRPPETQPDRWDVRIFAERQRSVSKETDFSLSHLIDGDNDFRPNITADAADQFGAALRLRTGGGINPQSFRWGSELELHGETGDYQFVRPSLRLRMSMPLTGRIAVGVEGAAGSSFMDTAPAQRQYQLGGIATIRGYGPARLRGESYWRGRGEIGYGATMLRLTAFADAGWAGPRDMFGDSKPIRSVGLGLGTLDGLIRIDLARALDAPKKWRLHLQFNGVL